MGSWISWISRITGKRRASMCGSKPRHGVAEPDENEDYRPLEAEGLARSGSMATATGPAGPFEIFVARGAAKFKRFGDMLPHRFLHLLHGLLGIDKIPRDR